MRICLATKENQELSVLMQHYRQLRRLFGLWLLTEGVAYPVGFVGLRLGLSETPRGTANSTLLPFVVRQGLSLQDALAGQFALACCDCASAFVREDIVLPMDAPGLCSFGAHILLATYF